MRASCSVWSGRRHGSGLYSSPSHWPVARQDFWGVDSKVNFDIQRYGDEVCSCISCFRFRFPLECFCCTTVNFASKQRVWQLFISGTAQIAAECSGKRFSFRTLIRTLGTFNCNCMQMGLFDGIAKAFSNALANEDLPTPQNEGFSQVLLELLSFAFGLISLRFPHVRTRGLYHLQKPYAPWFTGSFVRNRMPG